MQYGTGQLADAGRRRRQQMPTVAIWAASGALFLALTIYVFAAWLLSADFKPTLPGAPLDATTSRLIFWNQLIFSAICILCIWVWVVKPKLKTGRFSFLGLLAIASATTYWQDPMSNYYSFGIAYNAGFWNRGSWANFIPGFSYPGMERFPEAPLWVGTTYVWFNVLFPVAFAAVWLRLDRRFPRLRFGASIAVLLLLMFIVDVIQEVLYLRMGLYSYVGAIHSASIFGGRYFQFPIYIGTITSLFWLSVTWLIYKRNDKGQSAVELGIERLPLSARASTFVRFLALVGVMNLITLVAYFVPVQWLYTHGDAIPADTPGYLINGLCGPAAGFPCPGPRVPLPRRN